jgi:hypothetical protein
MTDSTQPEQGAAEKAASDDKIKTPGDILKEFIPEFNALCEKFNIKAAFLAMNPLPPVPGVQGQKFQIAINGDKDAVGYLVSQQQQIHMAMEELQKLRSAPIQKPPLQFKPH